MCSIIKLKTSDEEIFDVPIEIAKCSETISTMIDALGLNESEEEIIPLPNVKAPTLKKIIEWAVHHQNDPPLPPENGDIDDIDNLSVDLSPWDLTFFEVEHNTLFEILNSANYLNVRGLLTACCKFIANIIKGKTQSEIRSIFNIPKENESGENEDPKSTTSDNKSSDDESTDEQSENEFSDCETSDFYVHTEDDTSSSD